MSDEKTIEQPEARSHKPAADCSASDARKENVLISTIGTLEGLIDKGFMTGPKLLTEKGKQSLAELKKTGFACTPEETEWAMKVLMLPNVELTR